MFGRGAETTELREDERVSADPLKDPRDSNTARTLRTRLIATRHLLLWCPSRYWLKLGLMRGHVNNLAAWVYRGFAHSCDLHSWACWCSADHGVIPVIIGCASCSTARHLLIANGYRLVAYPDSQSATEGGVSSSPYFLECTARPGPSS